MSTDASVSVARKATIGATWMIAWRMITRVLGMASTLVLARILVPADFGLIAMASTFSLAVDAVSQLGLSDALVRRRDDDTALFDVAFTLQLARALLTAGVIVLAAPLASWWFNEPRLAPVLYVLAALTALSGLENVGIVDFRRSLRYDRQFIMLSVPRLLQVFATIVAAILLQNVWALLIGIATAKLSRLVITYALHPYRPSLAIKGWRELAGFSFWIWITSVVNVVWERCDSVLLGPALGSAALGEYLIAGEIGALPVTELVAPSADVLFSVFSSMQKRGGDVTEAAATVAVSLLMGVTPLVIAISALSGDLVQTLLGPKWVAAQPLIAILAWLSLFQPFSYVCSTLLVAQGRVRLNFLGNLAAAAIKLVALLIAISLTRDMVVFAGVGAAVMAGEATAFVTLLVWSGSLKPLVAVSGIARVVVAGGASAGVLALSGMGWHAPAGTMLGALLHCAATTGISVLVFAATVALAWTVSGRPKGPETLLRDALGNLAIGQKLRATVLALRRVSS